MLINTASIAVFDIRPSDQRPDEPQDGNQQLLTVWRLTAKTRERWKAAHERLWLRLESESRLYSVIPTAQLITPKISDSALA
jgi:hypothetical protein